jgi:L-asparaginase II
MQSVVLARVIRSGFEESVHLGHVAVCDADGRLLARAGDPERPVFARSSMKPLQAAVSLAAVGADAWAGTPDPDVSVMCASHNGEPIHVEAVQRVLDRAGLGVDALRCPPGWPIDPVAMGSAGERRRELHNCSGKHAGMLWASAASGWELETYRSPDHPLQRAVLGSVTDAIGARPLAVGTDGCGVPVHGMPLRAMATLFARLARPERLGRLEEAARRAVGAMTAAPYLVAGRGRIDTAVMEAAPGIVVKSGAEGLLCAALIERGVGVAVKAEDGSWRATDPAAVRTLHLLDAIDDAQVDRLAGFARPPVLGGGEPVGEIVTDLTLDR